MDKLFDLIKDCSIKDCSIKDCSIKEPSHKCDLVATPEYYVCRECFRIEIIYVNPYQTNTTVINHIYKPITHFKTKLTQLQHNEIKIIPQSVLDICKDCTIDTILHVLKKSHNSKFYKHKILILSLLGQPVPIISKLEEEQIISIFKQKYPKVKVKNNIPYTYVLYRIMMIINRSDIFPYLDITKNTKLLQKYDEIFNT